MPIPFFETPKARVLRPIAFDFGRSTWLERPAHRADPEGRVSENWPSVGTQPDVLVKILDNCFSFEGSHSQRQFCARSMSGFLRSPARAEAPCAGLAAHSSLRCVIPGDLEQFSMPSKMRMILADVRTSLAPDICCAQVSTFYRRYLALEGVRISNNLQNGQKNDLEIQRQCPLSHIP